MKLVSFAYLTKVLCTEGELHADCVGVVIGLRLPVDQDFNNQNWIVDGKFLNSKTKC